MELLQSVIAMDVGRNVGLHDDTDSGELIQVSQVAAALDMHLSRMMLVHL